MVDDCKFLVDETVRSFVRAAIVKTRRIMGTRQRFQSFIAPGRAPEQIATPTSWRQRVGLETLEDNRVVSMKVMRCLLWARWMGRAAQGLTSLPQGF